MKLLSLAEAAQTLGISRLTLRRLLADGELPSIRLRGRRLISEETLRQYIASKEKTV